MIPCADRNSLNDRPCSATQAMISCRYRSVRSIATLSFRLVMTSVHEAFANQSNYAHTSKARNFTPASCVDPK